MRARLAAAEAAAGSRGVERLGLGVDEMAASGLSAVSSESSLAATAAEIEAAKQRKKSCASVSPMKLVDTDPEDIDSEPGSSSDGGEQAAAVGGGDSGENVRGAQAE